MKVLSLLLQKSEASGRYITRWPRAVARLADLFWQLLIVVPPVYLAVVSAGIRIDNPLLFSLVVFFFALPFALLLDAFIGGLLGNTPAKVLVGLRVRNSNGSKLHLSQFVIRNFGVWTQGMCLGLLPLTLFSGLRQFKQITGRRPATYDEVMQTQVFSLPNSGMRAMLVTLLFFLSPIALLLASQMYEPSRNSASVRTTTVETDYSTAVQSATARSETTDAVVAEGDVAKATESGSEAINTNLDVASEAEIATEPLTDEVVAASSENEIVLVANAVAETIYAGNSSNVDKAVETESIAANPSSTSASSAGGTDSQSLWTNPVSGFATSISREFSVLTGQASEQRLATFNHRSGNSTISFEQHSVGQATDDEGLQQFLLSSYNEIELDGNWNSYEFGGQVIFEAQGSQSGGGSTVAIQATSTNSKIYVLLVQGNPLNSDTAKHDQLTSAIWNSM